MNFRRKLLSVFLCAVCLVTMLPAKQIKFSFEYEFKGNRKDLIQLIVLSDLFCNCVIFQTYERIGRKVSFLDRNIGGFPLVNLNLKDGDIYGRFDIDMDEEHLSFVAPIFFETFYNLSYKLLSPYEFSRIKSITRHFYEGQCDISHQTHDANSVVNELDDVDYRAFCQFLADCDLAEKMRVVIESQKGSEEPKAKQKPVEKVTVPQKTETPAQDQKRRVPDRRPTRNRYHRTTKFRPASLVGEMENRGWQFASPIVDYGIELPGFDGLLLTAQSFQLSISEEHKEDIAYIVTEMGKRSVPGLLGVASKLKRRGDRIKSVPTLQFLAYIFTTPHLKESMKKMRSSSFKWDKHMQADIATGLQRQENRGEISQQLEGFATFVGAPYDQLKSATEGQNWKQFVEVLIQN